MILCVAVGCAAALVAFVLGRSLAAVPPAALALRAMRAETALEIAHQNIELLRAEARELRADAGAARESAASQTAQLGEVRAQLDREREAIGEAGQQQRDTFQALAAEALKSANAQFLALAQGGLKSLVEKADGSLEQRQLAVAELVTPLREALAKLAAEQQRLSESRTKEAATLSAELLGLRAQNVQLSTETAKLVNALRAPQVRGRWGEIQLKRTAELAGMSEHCDFTEQTSVQGAEGLLRPDMVVNLPRGRQVIVDSKVPFTHYLEALESTSEAGREEALRKHALLVRAHVEKLSERRYWAEFRSAEFVVMFIPNDGFLAAAAERDPLLLEWSIELRVVLATPTTFIGLLRAIEAGWREERLAQNAERIAELGKELYDRLSTLSGNVAELGEGLKRTVRAYNRSVGSLESRVFPQARRFKELGAASEREIEEVLPIEELPRELN